MPTLPIQEWIRVLGEFYNQYGYLVVLLGTLGENTAILGFFLPGNTLALLGAAYARLGSLNLGLVILLASLGTILGYHIDYLIGRFALSRITNRWATNRLGRWLRLAGRLRLARQLLNKHGGKAILISHLIGPLRSFMALSAGMARMAYPRFLMFELVAAVAWNTMFCLLGYIIAVEIDTFQVIFERAGWVILGALILILLAWRFFKQRLRKRLRQERRAARYKQKSVAL